MAHFQNLRSLLNTPLDSHADYLTRLVRITLALYQEDAAHFKAECIPYIQGYAEHLEPLVYNTTSLEQLASIHELIPSVAKNLTLSCGCSRGDTLDLSLLDIPAMHAVRGIFIDHHQRGDRIAEKLLLSQTCPNLRHLSLSQCELTERTLELLQHSPLTTTLQSLSLEMGDGYGKLANRFSAEALATFLSLPLFDSLHTLRLEGGAFDDRSFTQFFQHIISAPHLDKLHTLSVNSSRRSCDTLLLPSLTSFTSRRAFRHLSLGWLNLNDADMEQLLALKLLEGVEYLDLRWNRFTHRGLKALFKSPQVKHLKELHLAMAKAPKSAFKVMCESPHLSQLKTLSMDIHDKIDDDTMRRLKLFKSAGRTITLTR